MIALIHVLLIVYKSSLKHQSVLILICAYLIYYVLGLSSRMKGPQKPNNISSNINPMLCTVLVYFYKRFDKLKQGRFDKGFIYFSYDGGNIYTIYSTCFKISTTESEFFDIDDTPVYINDLL